MSKIYGTIGYVFLIKNNRKIIVLSDQHDVLPSCENKINIAEWFKRKFNSSKILLEEVPRENQKLIELWETSPHTQELKNLFFHQRVQFMVNQDIFQLMKMKKKIQRILTAKVSLCLNGLLKITYPIQTLII